MPAEATTEARSPSRIRIVVPVGLEGPVNLGHDRPEDLVAVERRRQPFGDAEDRLQPIGQDGLLGGLVGGRRGGSAHRCPERERGQRRGWPARPGSRRRSTDQSPWSKPAGMTVTRIGAEADEHRPPARQEGGREEQRDGRQPDPERIVDPGREPGRRVEDQRRDRDQRRAERAGRAGRPARPRPGSSGSGRIRPMRDRRARRPRGQPRSCVPPWAPDRRSRARGRRARSQDRLSDWTCIASASSHRRSGRNASSLVLPTTPSVPGDRVRSGAIGWRDQAPRSTPKTCRTTLPSRIASSSDDQTDGGPGQHVRAAPVRVVAHQAAVVDEQDHEDRGRSAAADPAGSARRG